MMKLRATITIDISAATFLEAAKHQGTIEKLLETLKETYPEAKYDIKERREYAARPTRRRAPRGGPIA